MQTIYAFSYNPSIATGTNTTKTVWRMAYQQPILLYKGTANSIKLVIYNNAQKVVDLSSYDVQVQIVDKDTQEHFVTRTATIDTPTNGVATITFTEADLRNLQHRFYHIIARLMPPNDGSTVSNGEILYLDDNYGAFTPVTIEDAWNFDPTNISTTDGNASITFTSIGETPNSFTGYSGYYLRVNGAENSLEFTSTTSEINLLAVSSNIIPASDNTYALGNATNRWSGLSTGNITISGSNISTAPAGSSVLTFAANRHKINFTDVGITTGTGAILEFDDTSHGSGPTFEVWYGDPTDPYDPAGQHSLDIRAANPNSYVELASHDWDAYIGIEGSGAFIQTNWNADRTQAWRFQQTGELILPSKATITNLAQNVGINMENDDLRLSVEGIDGSTLHNIVLDNAGLTTFPGDVLPMVNNVHSLGSASNQWKDLYVSNSTIYLGGVPVSVDAGGNLLVNGNTVSGGGAANTGNITFSVATLSTSGTNQDMTLDPNGTGNVVVAANINASGNITSPRFISNIATGTAPFSVTSTTQVANLNVANAGHAVTADSATTATSATTAGTVTAASQPNITSVGTLAGLSVSGITSLGPIGNVQITGGSDGQYLRTNGAGVLSWATVTGGGAANLGNIDITDNTISTTNTNGNLILDPNGTGYVNVNNALQIIAPNGQVQGGLYTSGDADYLNIAADNARGLKFFVNYENGGITIHPNGVLATMGQVTTISNNTDLTIRTVNSTGPVNHDYIFGSDGVLTLPKGTEIRDIGTPGSTSGLELGNHGFTVDFGSAANDWALFSGANLIQMTPGAAFNITFAEVAQWQFNIDGNLYFPDGTTQSTAFNLDNIDISGNTISSINTNGDITLDPNGTGGVTITSAANNWVFTNSGYLTLPGNGYQRFESSGGYVGLFADANSGNTGIELYQDNAIDAKVGLGGQFNIHVNAGETSLKTWTFSNNGSLTLPGILILAGDSGQHLESSAGNVAILTDANTGSNNGIAIDQNNSLTAKIGLGGHIDLVVNSGDASQKTWAFGLDGNASFPGDLTIAGNITIQGGTTIVNTSDLTVEDSIINLHSQANLAPWTQDDGRDIGIAFHHYKSGADKHAYLVWQNDTSHLEYYSEGTETSGVISGTLGTIHANIFSANVATGTAPFIVNSTTQVANLNAATAGTAGTVTTAAQPNITSLGTLTALDVNAQANATIFKSNIATGTAPFIVTSTTQVANLNVAAAGSATTAGTVTTAAQPNITSVGTLTGLTVSGTIDATSSANVALGAVGNVHITGGTNGYVLSTDGSGNLSWVAQSGGGASTGNITFTTATISTSGTNENITLDPNGTGNVSIIGGTTITGNVTTPVLISNISTGTAPLTVTSTTQVANLNVAQAGQLINGNSNVTITANANVSVFVTGNATARAVFTSTGANIAGTANITGAVSMLSTLNVTGNANVGNIGAATAVITTAANVPLIQNSTSNITIASASNVTISSNGVANVFTVSATGANIAGTVNATGNANLANLYNTGTLTSTGNITTTGTGGNISGANVISANTITLSSNIILSTTRTPSTAVGATGDSTGMFAWDGSYIYICTGNYDGSTVIWRRASANSW